MMSAALETALTPTPHLAILHQQRLYIVSALQRTHIIIDGVRARLFQLEKALSGTKRQSSTHPERPLQSSFSYCPSSAPSSTLPAELCEASPEPPASQTADDQLQDIAEEPGQEQQQNCLSRATKKKLHHSRWRARGTLRNCTAEQHALLENLRTVQDRILRLQDAALQASTSVLTMPGPMAQTDFGAAPWTSGWAVEFGEKVPQLGCGFGPSEDGVPGEAAGFGAANGGAKQNMSSGGNPRTDTWMRDSTIPQNGNAMPILNAQLSPLMQYAQQQYPQLQINTGFNQAQFLQAAYAQQFVYSPAITSPLLLDPETTAEDLYDWENGDYGDDNAGNNSNNPNPYFSCVDPSAIQYSNNADPYGGNSFSHQPSAGDDSFDPYPQPIASPIVDPSQPSQQTSCRSPFPEEWDLATALKVGRSGSAAEPEEPEPKIDEVLHNAAAAAAATPKRPRGPPRKRHVRQLSALMSPRGSRVFHIDDLVPDYQVSQASERKKSCCSGWGDLSPGAGGSPGGIVEDDDEDAVGPAGEQQQQQQQQQRKQSTLGAPRDMGFGGWLEKPATGAGPAAAADEGEENELAMVTAPPPPQETETPGAAALGISMNLPQSMPGGKGNGKATKTLDPTSPTFVPGAGLFSPLVAAAAPSPVDAAMMSPPPLVHDSGLSSFSDDSSAAASPESVNKNGAKATVPPPMAVDVENKRRYSGYSAAAVDLLLNRFRENAANPIKKRRNWRRKNGGSNNNNNDNQNKISNRNSNGGNRGSGKTSHNEKVPVGPMQAV